MAYVADVPGCCSVTVLYQFSGGITINGWNKTLNKGSGRFISIIGDHQKTAYDRLCKKYTLESQSNPFMGNHGRKLIVCVFKIAKEKVK
jgi:hypothetical protein